MWHELKLTIRISVALLLSPVLVIGALTAVVATPNAASAQPAAPTPYQVPPNNKAYIYDTWGNLSSQTDANENISSLLEQEGYQVTEDSDVTPGYSDPPTGTTIASFEAMAKADPGVLILETHGVAPSPGVPGGFVIAVYNTQADALADCESTGSCFTNSKHQQYAGQDFWVANAEYKVGFTRYLYTFGAETTPHRWIVAVSPAGIQHLFGNDHIGLVFAGACQSVALDNFNADSYLGFVGNKNITRLFHKNEIATDEQQFFDLLGGEAPATSDVYRDTVDAARYQFQYPGLTLIQKSQRPEELSPAVNSVTPSGSTLGRMGVPGDVTFDSAMNTAVDPSQVVTVSGCGGASIDAGSAAWSSDGTRLTFAFSIPATSTGGTLTFTVHNHDAEALSQGTEGPNDFLDGNQGSSGVSGVEPNQTDYVWTEDCIVAGDPPGRYSGGESQNGNPVWLYVSASGTQVQDLVVELAALSCTGGLGVGGPIVLDSMNILSNGSFSMTTTRSGYIGADNASTTFVVTLNGTFGTTSKGLPEASGTYLETATYLTDSGSSGNCSSSSQTWSVTRDSQPAQPAGVGVAGTYKGGESQNGNPMSFDVSGTAIDNLDISLVGLSCNPGDGGVSTPVTLNSLAVSSDGSFSTTFGEQSQGVTYTIVFEGHFHGVNSTGASRAAGSYVVTGTFTHKGTSYNCTTSEQWWSATGTAA